MKLITMLPRRGLMKIYYLIPKNESKYGVCYYKTDKKFLLYITDRFSLKNILQAVKVIGLSNI